MKKRIWTCLGVVGVVTLAIVGAYLAAPEEATAALACSATTCDCTTNPLQSTAMVWGHGATCTEAFNDALAQSRALQNCADGTCFEQVIIDNACVMNPTTGQYMIDLHTDYRCYFCTTTSICKEPVPTEQF